MANLQPLAKFHLHRTRPAPPFPIPDQGHFSLAITLSQPVHGSHFLGIPEAGKRAEQCSCCHANCKAHHETHLYSVKAAGLRLPIWAHGHRHLEKKAQNPTQIYCFVCHASITKLGWRAGPRVSEPLISIVLEASQAFRLVSSPVKQDGPVSPSASPCERRYVSESCFRTSLCALQLPVSSARRRLAKPPLPGPSSRAAAGLGGRGAGQQICPLGAQGQGGGSRRRPP